jgi:DNA (cytosine-5-)-methyltransferase
MYKIVDLFCGAGGMSEGILQAGMNILFSSDINADVEKTYTNRHHQLGYKQGADTYFYRSDIRELTGKIIMEKINSLKNIKEKCSEIDVVFGGPPCQGFSRAGKRKKDDPRNLLFSEYLRIINEIKPRYVVMENVVGLIDMKFFNFIGIDEEKYEDGITTPEILTRELKKIGYNTKYKVLNALDYGVPQRRNRVVFLAYKNGEKEPNFPIKTIEKEVTVKEAISDLSKYNKNEKSKYQLESILGRTPNKNGETVIAKEQKNIEQSLHNQIITERFSLYKEGESGSELRKRIKENGIDLNGKTALLKLLSEKTEENFENIIKKFKEKNMEENWIDILLTKKNMRIRFSAEQPAATVVTLPDDYISPFENRTFTVRELARLQSFDDSFEFLGKRTTGGLRRRTEVPQYTQVGNAVPPLLSRAIAEEIKKCL